MPRGSKKTGRRLAVCATACSLILTVRLCVPDAARAQFAPGAPQPRQAAQSQTAPQHAQDAVAGQRQVVFFSVPVASSSAPVYASPSAKAPQTGAVLKDRFVEVYFRNDDGFCAIRPPYGSFSWISAKFVRAEDEKTGYVVSPSGKKIPSRVGCDSPATSSVVQVGLVAGQKVKIQGKVRLSNGSTWYKIAPPPGEFRWIRESDLAQNPPLDRLPPRLMYQDEYAQYLQELEQEALNAQIRQPAANPASPASKSLRSGLPPRPATSAPQRSVAAPPVARPALDNTQSAPTLAPAQQDALLLPRELSSDPFPAPAPAYSPAPAPLAQPQAPAQPQTQPQEEEDEFILTLPEFSSDAKSNPKERYAREEFATEIAFLNKEVFDAVGGKNASPDKIGELRYRAKELIKKADTKEDAALAQSILDIVDQTDARAKNLYQQSAPNAANSLDGAADAIARQWYDASPIQSAPPRNFAIQNPTGVMTPAPNFQPSDSLALSGSVVNGKFIPDVANVAQGIEIDASSLPDGRFDNGVFTPAPARQHSSAPFIPGSSLASGFPTGTLPATKSGKTAVVAPAKAPAERNAHEIASAPKAKSSSSFSRLGFAFSSANSPFRREGSATLATDVNTLNPTLARLPSLIGATPNVIVPPQDYATLPAASTLARSDSKKLAPGPTRAEIAQKKQNLAPKEESREVEIAFNSSQTIQPAGTQTEAIVFQAPEAVPLNAAPGFAEPELAADSWRAQGADEPIGAEFDDLVAEAVADSGKIRQTSAFAPVASKSFDNFDYSGTLVELTNEPDGAPKFALLDAAKGFSVIAYLVPEKNVSFAKFVGRKVVVRGAQGTVSVDGQKQKMVLVSSLFLQQ